MFHTFQRKRYGMKSAQGLHNQYHVLKSYILLIYHYVILLDHILQAKSMLRLRHMYLIVEILERLLQKTWFLLAPHQSFYSIWHSY